MLAAKLCDLPPLVSVFCQAGGKPLHTHNLVRRDFHPLIERAGLPRCRCHDLRHGHVAYLVLPGVPIKMAQDRVGHATAAMTPDVYSHVLAGQDADAARLVEARLRGSKTTNSARGTGC